MSYHILIRTYKFVKYIFQIPKYCPPRWTCQKLIDIPLILLSYFFCVELATCFGCWVTSTKIFHQNLSLVFRWCPPYFLYKISWYVDYLMMTGTQKFFFFLFLWHYPIQPVGMLTPVVVMETKWPQMNPGNYERHIFFYVRVQSSLNLMAIQT